MKKRMIYTVLVIGLALQNWVGVAAQVNPSVSPVAPNTIPVPNVTPLTPTQVQVPGVNPMGAGTNALPLTNPAAPQPAGTPAANPLPSNNVGISSSSTLPASAGTPVFNPSNGNTVSTQPILGTTSPSGSIGATSASSSTGVSTQLSVNIVGQGPVGVDIIPRGDSVPQPIMSDTLSIESIFNPMEIGGGCKTEAKIMPQDTGDFPVGIFSPSSDGSYLIKVVASPSNTNIMLEVWEDIDWKGASNLPAFVWEYLGVSPSANASEKARAWTKARRSLAIGFAKLTQEAEIRANAEKTSMLCFDVLVGGRMSTQPASDCEGKASYQLKKNSLYNIRLTAADTEDKSKPCTLIVVDCGCGKRYPESYLTTDNSSFEKMEIPLNQSYGISPGEKPKTEQVFFNTTFSGAESYKFEATPTFDGRIAFYQYEDPDDRSSYTLLASEPFAAHQPIDLLLSSVPSCRPIQMMIEYQQGRAGNFDAMVSSAQRN
jgi:hypothetical protein